MGRSKRLRNRTPPSHASSRKKREFSPALEGLTQRKRSAALDRCPQQKSVFPDKLRRVNDMKLHPPFQRPKLYECLGFGPRNLGFTKVSKNLLSDCVSIRANRQHTRLVPSLALRLQHQPVVGCPIYGCCRERQFV